MLISIQYLRGIAALLVVFAHFQVQLARYGSDQFLVNLNFGAIGVDLFFIISGFIIYYITSSKSISALPFLIDRAIRVVPLYWLYTSVMVVFAILFPTLLKSTIFEPSHTLFSFLFLPDFHPILAPKIYPILVQGWTLNYEMFFYLLFSISLMLPTNLSVKALLAALSLLPLLGVFADFENAILLFYTDLHLLEFLAGIVIGILHTRNKMPSANICLGLIPFGLLIFVLGESEIVDMTRTVKWGIPSLLFVLYAVAYERSKTVIFLPILKKLGDSSYSLYLSHTFVLSAIGFVWSKLSFNMSIYVDCIMLIVSVIACIIVGLLSYYIAEVPMTRYLKNKLSKS